MLRTHRLEKSTHLPVVTVVTNISYAYSLTQSPICPLYIIDPKVRKLWSWRNCECKDPVLEDFLLLALFDCCLYNSSD